MNPTNHPVPLSPTYYRTIQNMTPEQLAIFLQITGAQSENFGWGVEKAMTATLFTNTPEMTDEQQHILSGLGHYCTQMCTNAAAKGVLYLSPDNVSYLRAQIIGCINGNDLAGRTVEHIIRSWYIPLHMGWDARLELIQTDDAHKRALRVTIYRNNRPVKSSDLTRQIYGRHAIYAYNTVFSINVEKPHLVSDLCPDGTLEIKEIETDADFPAKARIIVRDGRIAVLHRENWQNTQKKTWMYVVDCHQENDILSYDMYHTLMTYNDFDDMEVSFTPAQKKTE